MLVMYLTIRITTIITPLKRIGRHEERGTKNGLPYVCDGSVTQNRHQYLSDVLDIAVTVKLWIPNILILI